MLDEIRQFYSQYADSFIPGWDKLNKNELCNLYIENENNETLKGAYLGAIISKYWNKIPKLYSKVQYIASEEEVYDQLLDGINYALEKRRWLDKDSSIYGDPNGPDKAINRKVKHLIMNLQVAANRQKRQANIGAISNESLEEDYGDLFSPKEYDDYDLVVSDLVKKYFNKKDFFNAFLIDGIINSNCFNKGENNETVFNKKRLLKHLNHLDGYLSTFSFLYDIDLEVVKRAAKYILDLNSTQIAEKVDNNLFIMRKVFNKNDYLD